MISPSGAERATRDGFSVVPLGWNTVESVVELHQRAFPQFFLSFLGPGFLREFYRSFLVDSQGVGLVAIAGDGRVLGGVVGAVEPAGYFKRLLVRRWWAFMWHSAGAVVSRPSVVPRLLRGFFYRGNAPAGGKGALLSSIAVLPEAQGQGVGRALVEAWVRCVAERGAGSAYLTTDAADNDGVNAFYLGTGWQLDAAYSTPEGRRMNRYWRPLPGAMT